MNRKPRTPFAPYWKPEVEAVSLILELASRFGEIEVCQHNCILYHRWEGVPTLRVYFPSEKRLFTGKFRRKLLEEK